MTAAPPDKWLNLAVETLGGALMDLGIVLQQGARDDNHAKRGNVALALERAAAALREEDFSAIDPIGKRLLAQQEPLIRAIEKVLITNKGYLPELESLYEIITNKSIGS